MAKPRPLSASQVAMLQSVRDHGDPWHHIVGRPQSVQGGAAGTFTSLHRRGLIEWSDISNDTRLTALGRGQLLDAEENRR